MPGTFVALDFETGGLQEHHPEIQVAAVAIADWKEVAAYESKIQFAESRADIEALQLNRYDRGVWAREARAENFVVRELGDFLRKHSHVDMVSRSTGRPYSVARLCGHNAQTFDGPRLQRMFKRHSAFLPASFQVLDTLQLALWHTERTGQKFPAYGLSVLCEALGIQTAGAHDALADVRMCVALARALVGPADV